MITEWKAVDELIRCHRILHLHKVRHNCEEFNRQIKELTFRDYGILPNSHQYEPDRNGQN